MSDENTVGAEGAQPVGLEGLAAQLVSSAGTNAKGLPTGYSVDDRCGKQRPGELALLWARASVGKSTLVMNFIANAPTVPTVFFSLEMQPFRLFEWLVPMSQDLPCHQREVEDVLANASDKRRPKVLDALQTTVRTFAALDIVQPSNAPSVSDLVRMVDDYYARTGLEVQRVFIDHLTLMRGCVAEKKAIDETTNALKRWAVTDGIAVMVIQHTGRGGMGDGARNDGHLPVTISSGVYSGEGAADWVFGAYRPDMDPKFADDTKRQGDQWEKVRNVTRFQVVKNRPFSTVTGPRGIDLVYQDRNRRLIER